VGRLWLPAIPIVPRSPVAGFLVNRLTCSGLPRLRAALDVSGGETSLRLTGAGLVHLQGLTQLQTLHLWDTTVTDAGVQRLQEALPNVRTRR
jgi:hypothetical protein